MPHEPRPCCRPPGAGPQPSEEHPFLDRLDQTDRAGCLAEPGEKDLPERARVAITYDGSNGRGSIQGVAINLSAGSDKQPENHVLYLDSRLSKRSFELVELLTRVAGHDSWKEGYGSCGTFEVDLHSGNVDRFRHMTRVMSLESENLDMRELLDTARMAA